MKRLFLLASVFALICGCQHQGPPGRDPFFGRTTVPPPPTGAAAATIDPYLQGGPGRAASSIPPAPGHLDAAVPGATASGPLPAARPANSQGWISAGSAPHGGPAAGMALADGRSSVGTGSASASIGTSAATLPSSPTAAGATSLSGNPTPSVIRIVEPDPATQAAAGGPASAGALFGPSANALAAAGPTPAGGSLGASILAGRPRVVRTLQPRSAAGASPLPSSTGNSSLPGRPLPAIAPVSTAAGTTGGGAVDIMDLPPVDRGAMASSPRASVSQATWLGEAPTAGGPSRLVSADVPQGGPASVASAVYEQPADPAAQGRYGYDPKYQWLRGRLEYSQIDRRWKLRYIPIDGQTDRYGGSVILADEKLLAGCERGDFVEVQGRVGKHDPRKGFAPEYKVSALKRLGR